MASKGRSIVSPLFRRSIAPRPTRLPRRTFLTQSQQRPRYLACQTNASLLYTNRGFSTTPRPRYADGDESFDPRLQDRESDEVDVCIVGGGAINCLLQRPLLLPNSLCRSCGSQRSYSAQTTSQ